MNPTPVGLFFAIGAATLFALKAIFIKLAYAEGVDPDALLLARMTIAMPVYIAVLAHLMVRGKASKLAPKLLALNIALGFIGYYLASYLDFQGLRFTSAQMERMALYSYPVFATLIAWAVYGDRPTYHTWIAVALTYAGVSALYLDEPIDTHPDTLLGIVLVIGAALSFATYVSLSKAVITKVGSLQFTAIAMLASTGFSVLHFGVIEPIDISALDGNTLYYGTILGIVCTVFPSFMMGEAIARIGPSKTSIVGSVGPVVTIAFSIALLNEPFGLYSALGMALVFYGVWWVGRAKT
ncbi:MAG: DMT family transporter [Gammaproteobacteria bacterium]|nr:DMT family transporter [Gammaproteobacteria bacterium]